MGWASWEIASIAYCGVSALFTAGHWLLHGPLPVECGDKAPKLAPPKYFFGFDSLLAAFVLSVLLFLILFYEVALILTVPLTRFLLTAVILTLFVQTFAYVAGGGAAYNVSTLRLSLLAFIPIPFGRAPLIFGSAVFVLLCAAVWRHDLAKYRIAPFWRICLMLLLAPYIVLTGLETEKPHLITKNIFAWVYGGYLCGFGLFMLAFFFVCVETTFLKKRVLALF